MTKTVIDRNGKTPTIWSVSFKLNGKTFRSCHQDLWTAQKAASEAMFGTKAKPKIKALKLYTDGSWK